MRIAQLKNGLVLAALIIPAAANAQSGTLFHDTFEERTMRSEWSAGSHLSLWTPIFSGFNGTYSTGYTTLALTQPQGLIPGGLTDGQPGGGGGGGNPPPPPPEGRWIQYSLNFDFFALDSWDGDATVHGPDRLRITVNNELKFRETFANQPGLSQSFRAPDIGRSNMGYNSLYLDAIYRNVGFTFTVPMNAPISITWADEGLQGYNDESWGIDNVRVTYEVVPSPGPLAALGATSLLALRRRRR